MANKLFTSIRRSGEKFSEEATERYHALVMPLWARRARQKKQTLCGAYIAVSGSCGKTTTSMLLSRLIGAQRSVALGVQNNTARFAMRSLRKLKDPVDIFVQEVSEFPLGTLAEVAGALEPDGAVITAIGLDHLSEFRNREAVATELATLAANVKASGIVCLNGDDPLAREIATSSVARVIFYGRTSGADFRAEAIDSHLPGCLSFDLVALDQRWRVKTRFAGTLMLENILAALAMVHGLGLDLDLAIAELASIEPYERRMGMFEGRDGHQYMLDTVKAPMWATKKLISDLPNIHAGRRIMVLGEMSDIGPNESQRYRQVLRLAAKSCDLVIGIGRSADQASRLRSIEPDVTNVRSARDMHDLAEMLRAEAPALVVLKGNKLDCSPLLAQVKPSAPSALLQPAV